MSTSQKPIAMNVDNKAKAGDDSSLNCFQGTTDSDSGVALGNMSETEQISAERESELDLSRILAELSPMPQVAEDAQTRRPEQLPSVGKPCESHDENSHEGSEDESTAINEPHGQETYEQQEQQVDEASKSDALHQSNQPVLEPLSPHDAQFAPRQNTLTPTISFPCFPSPASLSSCAYYNSRNVTDSCARSSGPHPRCSFQPLFSVANTSQGNQSFLKLL
ncbi:hypothetical protein Tcan_11281 [Toxocara canis]|uniref:Uncharacterized protein n=1 Tax=Toxocara canis TaxID=6265 RepID=A0A0B2VK41_TOXCA|nr:hypothetical protein Tcan_11281 [Toxocara canis]